MPETVIETPAEIILRKLSEERREELAKLLAEEKAEYRRLQEEMALLQSGMFYYFIYFLKPVYVKYLVLIQCFLTETISPKNMLIKDGPIVNLLVILNDV